MNELNNYANEITEVVNNITRYGFKDETQYWDIVNAAEELKTLAETLALEAGLLDDE